MCHTPEIEKVVSVARLAGVGDAQQHLRQPCHSPQRRGAPQVAPWRRRVGVCGGVYGRVCGRVHGSVCAGSQRASAAVRPRAAGLHRRQRRAGVLKRCLRGAGERKASLPPPPVLEAVPQPQEARRCYVAPRQCLCAACKAASGKHAWTAKLHEHRCQRHQEAGACKGSPCRYTPKGEWWVISKVSG